MTNITKEDIFYGKEFYDKADHIITVHRPIKKTIEILVGIPCSGKSTFCRLFNNKDTNVVCLSRDEIRENSRSFPNQPYKHTNENEDKVTTIFNGYLQDYLAPGSGFVQVILDNTHCKEGYIDEIIKKYGKEYNIEITFFEISLLKAHYRNIVRYFKTGKWIPFKIMNQMYKNFNKINRKKYTKYLSL